MKEGIRHYEKAVELDPALERRLVPVMERLMKSCEFFDRAKELGWSGDIHESVCLKPVNDLPNAMESGKFDKYVVIR